MLEKCLCGKNPHIDFWKNKYQIRCPICGKQTEWHMYEQNSIIEWNKLMNSYNKNTIGMLPKFNIGDTVYVRMAPSTNAAYIQKGKVTDKELLSYIITDDNDYVCKYDSRSLRCENPLRPSSRLYESKQALLDDEERKQLAYLISDGLGKIGESDAKYSNNYTPYNKLTLNKLRELWKFLEGEIYYN